MPCTLVIHAHPRPSQSIITRALLAVFDTHDHGDNAVEMRSLYALYPDFDIDVAAEQTALARADLIVWLAPVHWYSVPALLKHWFDQVLTHGWAYGHGSPALAGKTVWWVTSAGGGLADYAPGAAHGRPFADFVPPIEHTARFCAMRWLPPFVVHHGHAASEQARAAGCQTLANQWRQHLGQLTPTAVPPAPAP